jgi:hypothetical protein
MPTVREYLRTITLPWFFRKKFLRVFAVILLVAALAGGVLSWQLYTDAIDHGRTIRWKKVTEPLALPLLFLMLYAVIVLLWLAIKLKQYQGVMISNIGTVLQPQKITLQNGEEILAELTLTTRISPGELGKMGVLRITNERMLHSQTISHKRVAVLVGMNEPDLTFAIPLSSIRQCGFGLDEKDPKRFIVIERNGTTHGFGNVRMYEIESAFKTLNWKRSVIGEHITWIN